MPLYLTYHPWSQGVVGPDQVVSLMCGAYEAWRSRGITYRVYIGTSGGSEGYSLVSAPSRSALIQAFEEYRVPYLTVCEAWEVSAEDLRLAASAGRGSPRVL